MKTETPLIDLAPKLFSTVRQAQEVLAEWILPDSKITDSDCLSNLLEILDDRILVERMREVAP